MFIYEFLHTLKQAHEPSFKYKNFTINQTNDQTRMCHFLFQRNVFIFLEPKIYFLNPENTKL